MGYELVKTFLKEDWAVATCGRRKAIIDRMNSDGNDDLLAEICDVAIESSVVVFLREVAREFGGINLLVLNAAALGPTPLPEISNMNLKDLRMTFETNFFGNFQVLQRALPLMRTEGKIVHITSDAATVPYPGWGAYSSSKVAFDTIIKILDKEPSPKNIRAFTFDPGDMDTEMHHKAIPDDISHLKDPKDAAKELYLLITGKEKMVID